MRLPEDSLRGARTGVRHDSRGCSSRNSTVWLSLYFYHLLGAAGALETTQTATWTFLFVALMLRAQTPEHSRGGEVVCGLWKVPCLWSYVTVRPIRPPHPSQCPFPAAVRALEFLMTDLWSPLGLCVKVILQAAVFLVSGLCPALSCVADSLFGPLLMGLFGPPAATP